MDFVWPDEQTLLLALDSVVLGCHCEMLEGEMECVDELGTEEDQTATRANET